ncbi:MULTISPECIES: CD1871A family CXXC motif-containing protein [Anaerococcus]|uniref:Thioredoxin n=3 Tax=Anaerococcus TaxID=165779 RepID=C7HV06_9FIRM|nr:hypothetical protein HMPREF0078_1063 [Anaerococcus vaginalis ATCC 51170]MBS4889681.1 hypothetical protein [Anaerococcus vaginalis]MBS6921149.1 hypothetical protein [Anaerococcus vaginalis]QQB61431.1 hypothetical protein I6H45_06295 [Anaerococcus vaginalis]QQN56098.1 hypothetical protein I6H46_00085 [Anaerococcus obesiensis]
MIDIEIKKKKNIQIGFLILAIGFISYGAFRGEVDTVFSKAIKLCLECVGIG